jgi:fatty-acyl-CoA synthase
VRLVDYLDKGASLGSGSPCLTTDGQSWSYAEVRELSFRISA